MFSFFKKEKKLVDITPQKVMLLYNDAFNYCMDQLIRENEEPDRNAFNEIIDHHAREMNVPKDIIGNMTRSFLKEVKKDKEGLKIYLQYLNEKTEKALETCEEELSKEVEEMEKRTK